MVEKVVVMNCHVQQKVKSMVCVSLKRKTSCPKGNFAVNDL